MRTTIAAACALALVMASCGYCRAQCAPAQEPPVVVTPPDPAPITVQPHHSTVIVQPHPPTVTTGQPPSQPMPRGRLGLSTVPPQPIADQPAVVQPQPVVVAPQPVVVVPQTPVVISGPTYGWMWTHGRWRLRAYYGGRWHAR